MTSFQAEQLGKYIILDKLAVGGMAELFRAMITSVQGFEKLIAIKKILPHLASEEDLVGSFIDEAKLAALLHHQNIVQIYDFGSLEETYFIAMEYLLGKDCRIIRKKAKENNIPIDQQNALLIVSRICAGLDYAHKLKDFQGKPLNIIHRDISPQNILITYEGDVKIVDFGIAKAASHNTQTQMGLIKGKVAYMSPEQAAGKVIDHRSDIFSCGIILYEFVTGQRMFSGDTMHILSKIKDADFVKPEELHKDLSDELLAVLDRALQKDPDDRYQTCAEMLNDLDKCMQLGMHPTSQGLSKYMKTLFADEIVAEERHLQHVSKIGLMEGNEDAASLDDLAEHDDPTEILSTTSSVPDIEPDNQTSTDSSEIVKKNKKPVFILLAAGIILGIALLIFISNTEDTPSSSSPEKISHPGTPAETPGTETYKKAMDALIGKRFAESCALFEELIDLGPGMKEKIASPYAEALLGQANILRETDTSQAINLYNKSILFDPESEQVHFQLGLVYMQQKNYAAAIKCYEDVVKINPRFPDTFFNLGFIYALSKDYAKAEEKYARVVELRPKYLDEALFNLALVQSKLNKKEESIANLKRAVQVNPQNKLAQNYLKKIKGVSGK